MTSIARNELQKALRRMERRAIIPEIEEQLKNAKGKEKKKLEDKA